MSQTLKILLGVFGLLVVAAVLLTMLGKLDLPLGPLNGMLAKEETAAPEDGVLAAEPGSEFDAAVDCPPETGAGTDPLTDPNAVDPSASGAVDPTTGAPIASGAGDWDGTERVVAAGAGDYDPGRVSDSVIVAADAVDPVTGAPVDPLAADPVADPNAAPVDPTTAADPLAGGAGVDPCADAGADAGLGTGAGTDPGTGAGTGAGAPAGGAGGAAARATSDGSNSGNSPEALRAAKDATAVMEKAKIQVTTTASLVPTVGGIGRPAVLKRYRATVTAATLVMKLDAAAQQQWTGAGKKVQSDLVKSFLARLGKSYRKATRSVTVVDEGGNVLAVGDAPPRAAGSVKLF